MKRMLAMMILALCIAFSAQGFAQAVNQTSGKTSMAVSGALADEIVRQVNVERSRRNLRALRVSAELNRAARVRANEITRRFSHTRPDGSAWRTVSSAAYGENIAMGQRTADKVMAATYCAPATAASACALSSPAALPTGYSCLESNQSAIRSRCATCIFARQYRRGSYPDSPASAVPPLRMTTQSGLSSGTERTRSRSFYIIYTAFMPRYCSSTRPDAAAHTQRYT